MPDFIESAGFLQQKYWPISKHRALAQFKNPRADETDVALIVAYKEKHIVGYIGALPDYLMIPQNITKIAWLSCWWVLPKLRKTGLGKQLLDAIIDVYEKRVILTGFTKEAENVYANHIDLERLPSLRGYTYCFKSIKYKKVTSTSFGGLLAKALFKANDVVLNSIFVTGIGLKKFKTMSTRVVEVGNVNDLDAFFEPFMLRNIFKRNVNSLNWIKDNPWVVPEPFDKEQKKRYYFTSSSKKFFCKHFVIYDNDNKVESYFMVTFNNNKLSIPYLFSKGGTIGEISDFLWHLAATLNADELTFYHKFLGEYLQSVNYPSFSKKETYRKYYAGNFISWYFKDESDITISDGDGDCAFV